MNVAESYQDLLSTIVDRTWIDRASTTMLCVFDRSLKAGQMPDWIFPVAHRSIDLVEIAFRYPLNAFEVNPGTLFSQEPLIIEIVEKDNRLDRIARTLFRDVFRARIVLFMPLVLADNVIGFLGAFFRDKVALPEAEIQRLMAIAGQAAIAVQSRLLLEQAQRQASQEERIRKVTSNIFNATDVDSTMRRSVEQVGRVLGRSAYIYLGQGKGELKE
jgi:GAF domain-containing protein